MTNGDRVTDGLIEVDEELMFVTSVDPATNTATVIRGMYGSTAQTHALGAVVRDSPRVPRWAVMRALNATITSSYPDLFAVSTTTFVAGTWTLGYELPADCDEVFDVFWQDEQTTTGYWHRLSKWRVQMKANTGAFASGKSIDILESVLPGQTIQVVYRKVPAALTALTDDFAGVTGLQDSAREAIVYGACAKLTGYVEPARLSDDSAEAKFIDSQQPGSALAAGRYFYGLYMNARQEEATRLLNRYANRSHFTR